MPSFPRRPRSHSIEEISRNQLRQNLPEDWICLDINPDYGVDNLIEICEEEQMRGNSFSIQLKATDRDFSTRNYLTVTMNTRTINYLMHRAELVMIVLYSSIENESYWIWLRSVNHGIDFNNQSATIRIPKTNRLSQIDWTRITAFTDRIRSMKINHARNEDFTYDEQE